MLDRSNEMQQLGGDRPRVLDRTRSAARRIYLKTLCQDRRLPSVAVGEQLLLVVR